MLASVRDDLSPLFLSMLSGRITLHPFPANPQRIGHCCHRGTGTTDPAYVSWSHKIPSRGLVDLWLRGGCMGIVVCS